jgi:hypothetical protein
MKLETKLIKAFYSFFGDSYGGAKGTCSATLHIFCASSNLSPRNRHKHFAYL